MSGFDSLHPLHFTFLFVQGTDAPSIFTNTLPGNGCNMNSSEFRVHENETVIARLLATWGR